MIRSAPKSVIAPVYKSIVRRITDIIEELNGVEGMPELGYHNWESRSDENQLPRKTLIGDGGFTFAENEGLWMIRLALGVSSYQDANLLNEIELIDQLQQRLGEGRKVPLLEMDYGEQVSELVVTEFELLPMSSSQLRNYRPIGIELRRTEIDR